jgi:hypothetical protein
VARASDHKEKDDRLGLWGEVRLPRSERINLRRRAIPTLLCRQITSHERGECNGTKTIRRPGKKIAAVTGQNRLINSICHLDYLR